MSNPDPALLPKGAPDDLTPVPGEVLSAARQTTPKKPALLRVTKPPTGLLVAVESKCRECGTDLHATTDPVRDCRAYQCPLWAVRPEQPTTRDKLWTCIRAKCRRCQGPDPGVEQRIATCEIPTCALWPVREYREHELVPASKYSSEAGQ
jgi:hypothetical protein